MMERRARDRFAIQRQLHWRCRPPHKWGSHQYEAGFSIDIASTGIYIGFSGPRPPDGALIEAWVDWPVMLDRGDAFVPLQLHITGHVVRETPEGFVVAFNKYEFRTKKAASAVA
jgi:hypothetical protein